MKTAGPFKEEAARWRSLTGAERLYALYFCLSLCLLCVADSSPAWVIVAVAVNFANAVRLVKRVPVDKLTGDN